MRLTMILGALLALPGLIFAQFSLSGTIIDGTSQKPLPSARVWLADTPYGVIADLEGKFEFKGLKKGQYTLQASFLGYVTAQKQVVFEDDAQPALQVEIILSEAVLLQDEVVITALRADENSSTTFTKVDKTELQKQNLGQDLPFLLNQTPSVVVTSDAGTGVGYTGIRIRGSDATRVNVTLNGIPMNDAESQGTYWVDLPDFASSVDNIQVQRGVGSSTNGAGAFGGSVNIQTDKLSETPFGEINATYGSFNTLKTNLMLGTGLIKDHVAFTGRLSRISSDGYVDRASSNLMSYFLSGAYYGKHSLLKVNVFSGKEVTYQAWYGINEDSLGSNRTFNEAGTDFLQKADPYDREVDDYRQDHYQLLFSQDIGQSFNLNAALHLTRGIGFYEQYKVGQTLSDYGLDTVFTGNDTLTSTDLIRRRWLDNYFFGGTFSANYNPKTDWKMTLGGAFHHYDGKHYGEVIWAQFASNANNRHRYYENQADKEDFNVFAKGSWQALKWMTLYADLQYRYVGYTFLGYDNNGNNVTQSVNHHFFNPKAGFNFRAAANKNIYASFAIGNREPSRDDYTSSTPNSRPKPETLYDIEAGYRQSGRIYAFSANIYAMLYKNQLVLTGQVNDVGAYTRTNTPNSSRLGLEVEGSVNLLKNLKLAVNATLSRNKVAIFSEFLDDYDVGGQVETKYKNTDIAFSPSLIAGGSLSYSPLKGLEIALLPKFVGRQYLDNTQVRSRSLDPYFVTDFRAMYSFSFKFLKEIRLSLLVNNLFNARYESNGYTYGFRYGGDELRYNYLYPQAGIHALGAVGVRF